MTSPSEVPRWFTDAIENKPKVRNVEVNDCAINYLQWGDPAHPGLVLVHGGAAHAYWWAHIAPLLASNHCVVAIDLSGHGDSGRRETYGLDSWCDEVAAVAADAGLERPVVVGHSMGGFVTAATAARHSELVGGAIIVDSPIREMDPEVEAARSSNVFGKPRVYEDFEAAVARFRTIPAQEGDLAYVKDFVARHSLRKADEGWTWKFDPAIFVPPRREAAEILPLVKCRVALVRAEHGLVDEDIGSYMYQKLGRVAPMFVLPTAGHHPMLDVPLILVTALRALLADWDHSTPYVRSED